MHRHRESRREKESVCVRTQERKREKHNTIDKRLCGSTRAEERRQRRQNVREGNAQGCHLEAGTLAMGTAAGAESDCIGAQADCTGALLCAGARSLGSYPPPAAVHRCSFVHIYMNIYASIYIISVHAHKT